MNIYLAKTQGFCAGVSFAVEIVERALKKYGAPLYVYHEIVHNTFVVKDFQDKGVIFVEDINEVPKGSRVIYSAHGVPPTVIEESKNRKLTSVDATCPLVTKVHNEAVKFSEKNMETILIGHHGHQELIGTSGYIKENLKHIIEDDKDIDNLKIKENANVAYITQTTLSVDDTTEMIHKLKTKFKNLDAPSRSDLCFATQNRQDAVKELAQFCDFIIICGSQNSSNSNRLRETGEKSGTLSIIIDSVEDLNIDDLRGKEKIGISSGASVPRVVVDDLVKRIIECFPRSLVKTFDNPEKNIVFALPKI